MDVTEFCCICGGDIVSLNARISSQLPLDFCGKSLEQFLDENSVLSSAVPPCDVCEPCYELLKHSDRLWFDFFKSIEVLRTRHSTYENVKAAYLGSSPNKVNDFHEDGLNPVIPEVKVEFHHDDNDDDDKEREEEDDVVEEEPIKRRRGRPRKTDARECKKSKKLPKPGTPKNKSRPTEKEPKRKGRRIKEKKPTKEKTLDCPHCDEKFSYSGMRTKHIKTVHPNEYVPESLFCDCCGKIFASVSSLKIHRGEYDYAGVCFICGEYAKNVKVHVNQRHKGPKPCEICGKQLDSNYERRTHLLKEHGKGKGRSRTKYTCQDCSRTFLAKPKFIKHRAKQHGDIPDAKFIYHCEHCGREFYCKDELKEHVNGHLGITPHQCPICSYATNLDTSLRIHMRQVHKTRLSEVKAQRALEAQQAAEASEAAAKVEPDAAPSEVPEVRENMSPPIFPGEVPPMPVPFFFQ